MDTDTLLTHVERLKNVVQHAGTDWPSLRGAQAQVTEFFGKFAGEESSFFKLAQRQTGQAARVSQGLISALENFQSYVEAGLLDDITPVRRAQLDVVSDFLDQAHSVLQSNGVHPAAPIVLIGATLEEFLRTWIESKHLSLGQRKPSLDAYSHVLLAANLITKQDVKDLTAWGGLRNHAAHGEWAEVADKQRASLMLEGVNLFMR